MSKQAFNISDILKCANTFMIAKIAKSCNKGKQNILAARREAQLKGIYCSVAFGNK